uniref:Uncharacterized protein n=1 Tax=Tanacetum cinerariifolium TaxID=118510 RepID=A0A6L2JM84_TANCI|nr:hypothetical protein [Tanacetum cinerariifolium]
MMFATGKPIDAIAIKILDDLLTEEIKQTKAYNAYDDAYIGVEVPTTQTSRVVSTQGTNRTLSAPRSPKPQRTLKKKKEKVVGESREEEVDVGFIDSLNISQEDSDTRLDQGSHKERPGEKNDDVDDEDDNVY